MKRRGVTTVGAVVGAAGALAWSGWTLERVVAQRLKAEEAELRSAGLVVASDTRSRVIDVSDGGRIHVLDAGQGPTVVLLHGITLNASIFALTIRDLKASHRVIAIDLRGHGNSLAGEEGLSIDRLARDVVEVIVALDLDHFVLLGHSMGGKVAQQALGVYGESLGSRVDHVILLGSSAGPASQSAPERAVLRGLQKAVTRGLKRRANRGDGVFPGNDAAIWLARAGFGRNADPVMVEFSKSVSQSTAPAVVARLLESLFAFDGRDTLVSIAQSATVMVGTRDLLAPPRHARSMSQLMRNAEYQEVHGVGHMIMLEAPDELATCIKAATWRSRHPSA